MVLFEFGHDLVHLVIRIAAGGIGIHRFSAITTGLSFFVQKRVLGGTCSLKLSVFQKYQPD